MWTARQEIPKYSWLSGSLGLSFPVVLLEKSNPTLSSRKTGGQRFGTPRLWRHAERGGAGGGASGRSDSNFVGLAAGGHVGRHLRVRVGHEGGCLHSAKRHRCRLLQADAGDDHRSSQWAACRSEALDRRRHAEGWLGRCGRVLAKAIGSSCSGQVRANAFVLLDVLAKGADGAFFAADHGFEFLVELRETIPVRSMEGVQPWLW
jgi:hypothetical protein